MVKIAVCGVLGKMGRVIVNEIEQRENCEVAAGVDLALDSLKEQSGMGFPLFTKVSSLSELPLQPDVIIDFSHPSALEDLLNYALSTATPVVLACTGYSPVQVEQIKKASLQIPVFFTANMSLGVNLLVSLAQKAASVLGEQFDIEVLEMHHNQKLDAPSGTALMLAAALNKERGNGCQYVYDRHSVRQKRDKSEIGIHSIRGGTIVGEHSVIFAGRDETVTLTHQATSKDVFGVGAVNAALFLVTCKPGLYDMGKLVLGGGQ